MLLRMKTRMIQIRHVPEDVHQALKERAKREGISLSDYLRRELMLITQKLTWEELFEEMDRDARSFDGLEGIDSAELIREGREERDRELMGRILDNDQEP
jgi:plasmid stability protein